MYVYLHLRALGSVGVVPGVRYLEVNLYWKVTLGTGLLSAVRNQEASASQRLHKYYNHAKSNP